MMTEHRAAAETSPRADAARYWRTAFALRRGDEGGAFESATRASPAREPRDRIAEAREAMVRLVTDRFGGDAALLERVRSIALSAEEALDVLREDSEATIPTNAQMESLEAIVAFDGSRPSFLLRENEVDFDSSFNTGTWKRDLKPFLEQLREHAACVGRVEIDGIHEGTAFLVTPTLAITNRHVAQTFATFSAGKITLKGHPTIDFGRERDGLRSFDPRTITDVAFAGPAAVAPPMDHERLDLAVLRLSESKLTGAVGKRHMVIGGVTAADVIDDRRFLATVGYPSDPEFFVSETVWSEYGDVIRRLLEGDGGAKRLAPGQPMESVRAGLTDWTATHDATTINGNSGSPLLKFPTLSGDDPPRAAGLHYGGRSGGDRVNWAHLLHYATDKTGYGDQGTFGDFCRREGIQLS